MEYKDITIAGLEISEFVELGQAIDYLCKISSAQSKRIEMIDMEIGQLKAQRQKKMLNVDSLNPKDVVAMDDAVKAKENEQERLRLFLVRADTEITTLTSVLLDAMVPAPELAETIVEKIKKNATKRVRQTKSTPAPKKPRKRRYTGTNQAHLILQKLEDEDENAHPAMPKDELKKQFPDDWQDRNEKGLLQPEMEVEQ